MPQLMPLYWIMSSFMLILFFFMIMLFYGNYMEVKNTNIYVISGENFNKWLW